jgi:hypothetical protein
MLLDTAISCSTSLPAAAVMSSTEPMRCSATAPDERVNSSHQACAEEAAVQSQQGAGVNHAFAVNHSTLCVALSLCSPEGRGSWRQVISAAELGAGHSNRPMEDRNIMQSSGAHWFSRLPLHGRRSETCVPLHARQSETCGRPTCRQCSDMQRTAAPVRQLDPPTYAAQGAPWPAA